MGQLLRDCGFLGVDADPMRVRASFDADGRPRRVHAHYAGGWSCVLTLYVDGTYALSQSLRIRITDRMVPA